MTMLCQEGACHSGRVSAAEGHIMFEGISVKAVPRRCNKREIWEGSDAFLALSIQTPRGPH